MDESKIAIETLSSIIEICRSSPECMKHATQRLTEIIQQFDPTSEIAEKTVPGSAKHDILAHIKNKEKDGEPIKLKSTMLRDIATTLSKNFDIPYNAKLIKKKCDLFKWFEEHWFKIRDPFFILMDKHHEAVSK
ncbi:hypothetical protein M9Y10_045271 [Tritrichomonas musculus]|uniref:Uncharacterized protein n=1 Tax=Tritrichomonas musculus TaxID=1915356 RepID=A0ABR2JUS3_9EUKA